MTPKESHITALLARSEWLTRRPNRENGYRQALVESAELWGQVVALMEKEK